MILPHADDSKISGRALDAVIVGSGPNGLTAGIVLSAHGLRVKIIEARDTPGGGLRSGALTLPGYIHDHCSAVHPIGDLSPVFKALGLERYGLEWCHSEVSAAHPLESGDAVLLQRSLEATAADLGRDRDRYLNTLGPLLENFDRILKDVLEPPGFNKAFVPLARFGSKGLFPASALANCLFRDERAKALFAGCAAHSILPLDMLGTAAVGLIFLLAGHKADWPIAKGGSGEIAKALVRAFEHAGGEIECGREVLTFSELPKASLYLFDLSPDQLMRINKDQLPPRYCKQLQHYRYGPAVFKIDYALSEPIPWQDSRCGGASTVHVGGTMDEIKQSERDAWDGRPNDNPFVMVCQQSHFDGSRAPEGKATGYAYCHVPFGSKMDRVDAIEKQIERFAPGFRDCIIQRHTMTPRDLELYNPSNFGGTITGGAATISQLLFRPAFRFDPYSTPNKRIFICSHATPPGGGVHGMCGFNAARSVLKRLGVPYDHSALSNLKSQSPET